MNLQESKKTLVSCQTRSMNSTLPKEPDAGISKLHKGDLLRRTLILDLKLFIEPDQSLFLEVSGPTYGSMMKAFGQAHDVARVGSSCRVLPSSFGRLQCQDYVMLGLAMTFGLAQFASHGGKLNESLARTLLCPLEAKFVEPFCKLCGVAVYWVACIDDGTRFRL